jgi:adenosine deaminase
MSIESFIHAMPKVELDIQLEGTLREERMLVIAEQNEIEEKIKNFRQWVNLLREPVYERRYEFMTMMTQWLEQPEDVIYVVYELGVALAKQNVRYAEVSLNPIKFTEIGSSFEELLNMLSDGRDRAERAWGVRMNWILSIPRHNPRTADEIARWATTASIRKAGVVGIGLIGEEDAQPIGQFERAFRTAEKKGVARLPSAGEKLGAEGVRLVIEQLYPDRIVDGWGIADDKDLIQLLYNQQTPINLCMARAIRAGQISSYAGYPLRRLFDEGLKLTIASGMPSIYGTTLSEEYQAAVEQCGLDIDELEELALNAVRFSLLSEESKQTLLAEFSQEYARLRAELLTDETA